VDSGCLLRTTRKNGCLQPLLCQRTENALASRHCWDALDDETDSQWFAEKTGAQVRRMHDLSMHRHNSPCPPAT
jgi:hypothetical protein